MPRAAGTAGAVVLAKKVPSEDRKLRNSVERMAAIRAAGPSASR